MSPAFSPRFAVVLIDDEEFVLDSLYGVLASAGITNIIRVKESGAVMTTLAGADVGIVLLDLIMPSISGEELLHLIRQNHPHVSIVVVTGKGEIERAVECMKAGASDYLVKPVERSRLVATVRRLIDNQELMRENDSLKNQLLSSRIEFPKAFSRIITVNETMKSIMRYAQAISRTSHPVLITGETGVGKELFASAIHDLSEREGEFVPVNSAGLDDALFADLLFGHRAGAFTGATEDLDGLLDRARDGTLFLDEIGDLSPSSQVKLLRLLETGEYYPLGSDLMKRGKARIIVATNRDLASAVSAGGFRRDLYFRLNIHHIRVPPLRERLEDVPLLVEHFIMEAARELGKTPPTAPPQIVALLKNYQYPGNLRELKSMIFDAVSSHASGVLSLRTLGETVRQAAGREAKTSPQSPIPFSFPAPLPSIKECVDMLVREALNRAEGNQTVAARLLGITPQAVSKRLKQKRVSN